MKNFKLLIVSVFLCLQGCQNLPPKTNKDLTTAILSKSGIDKDTKTISEVMHSSLLNVDLPLAPNQISLLNQMIPQYFRSEIFYSKLYAKLMSMPEQEKKFLLDWYGSMIGKKVIALENKARSANGKTQIQQKVMNLSPSSFSPADIYFSQKIIFLSKSLEVMVSIFVTADFLQNHLLEVLKQNNKISIEKIFLQSQVRKELLAKAWFPHIQKVVMVLYGPLNSVERRNYIKFLSHPHTAKFLALFVETVQSTLQSKSLEFSRNLERRLRPIKRSESRPQRLKAINQ